MLGILRCSLLGSERGERATSWPVSKILSHFQKKIASIRQRFLNIVYVTANAQLSLPWKQIYSIALGHKAKKIFFVIKSEGERMA